MDLVEPLRMTLGSIHGLIEGKSELKSECAELELSVTLVSQCLDSLHTEQASSASVKSVIEQISALMHEANSKLEAIAKNMGSGLWSSLWGGMSAADKTEISQLSARLTKLTSFLNLALSSSQSSSQGDKQEFNPASFLPKGSAEFWVKHFGKEYEVPTKRFTEALRFHLKPAELNDVALDALGDSVSVYGLSDALGSETLATVFTRAAQKRKANLSRISTVVVKKSRPGEFSLEATDHILRASGGSLKVGRNEHPSLQDPRLSSTHAILEYKDGAVVITDKSSNGVWVNGVKLTKDEPFTLKEGDKIVVLFKPKIEYTLSF